jgi:hypothetical protein
LDITLVVLGALLILMAAFVALGGANLLNVPGSDFFAFLEKMFYFLEQKVGLAGQETRDWFCQKDLQENIEICKLTPDMLREYCDMVDKEKIGTCQMPGEEIKAFCEEQWSKRESVCKNQNEFNSGCEGINANKDAGGTKDLPFCK